MQLPREGEDSGEILLNSGSSSSRGNHPNNSSNDSGNSSLLFDDYTDSMLSCWQPTKKKSATAANKNSLTGHQLGATGRRNRVSNISNGSNDSTATSGVSTVSSTMSTLEGGAGCLEDGIATTSSSSSLGSSTSSNYYSATGTSSSSSSSSSIERNDSGVGTEMMMLSVKEPADHHCADCDAQRQPDSEPQKRSSTYVCAHCEKRRNERKEIISEIVDTELKYGRDLRIILEEFARPISVAGLLTAAQVDEIFLNLDELIEVNCHFADRLQEALETAVEQGDEVKCET